MILIIGKNGFGKIIYYSFFRLVYRGGKGVIGINSDKVGNLVFVCFVNLYDEILMIIISGFIIRIFIKDINEIGRVIKGVKLINLKKKE